MSIYVTIVVSYRYRIVRQKLDGTGGEIFLGDEVDNCEGLAIDWMSESSTYP